MMHSCLHSHVYMQRHTHSHHQNFWVLIAIFYWLLSGTNLKICIQWICHNQKVRYPLDTSSSQGFKAAGHQSTKGLLRPLDTSSLLLLYVFYVCFFFQKLHGHYAFENTDGIDKHNIKASAIPVDAIPVNNNSSLCFLKWPSSWENLSNVLREQQTQIRAVRSVPLFAV